MSAPHRSRRVDDRLAKFLLLAAVGSFLIAILTVIGWYRAETSDVGLRDLSPEDRQLLVEELEQELPGVYANAWFEPEIGYTFQPGTEVALPFDSFVADGLGFRNPRVEKPPDTFRVLFVGDSWTFGHGVRAADSFPVAFQDLAQGQVKGVEVEAWTLALSGYSAVNQLAALTFFSEKLAPDAVVICPSTNDNDSSYFVLPNGSLARLGKLADELGDPHPVTYRHIAVDSYRYRQRWTSVFDRYRQVEKRLDEVGVPLLYFFVAHWPSGVVHHLVSEADLQKPYLVNPEELRTGRWRDPEYGHGTAAANRLYGRIVYQGLAQLLDWPLLPLSGDASDIVLHRETPEGDWSLEYDSQLRNFTERFIEDSFTPPQKSDKQCVGPMNCETGRIGRSSTVLVRRDRGSNSLEIELARVSGARYLYPLGVTISIPSPRDGRRVRTTVPATGEIQRVVIEIPEDLPPGSALDVVFEADRATAVGPGSVASSVLVQSIRQN